MRAGDCRLAAYDAHHRIRMRNGKGDELLLFHVDEFGPGIEGKRKTVAGHRA